MLTQFCLPSCRTRCPSIQLLVILFLTYSLCPLEAHAEEFSVQQVFGDGNKGRVFRQWRRQIKELPVKSVSIELRKQRGGNNTYVNLRFGKGETFENGRRAYLKSTATQTITWNVGNQTPRGLPLVLNVYNGEVYVETVRVRYRNEEEVSPRPESVPRRPRDEAPPVAEEASDEREALRFCRRARIRRPRIEIGRVRPSGGLFSGKYKISGSIRGNCIEEAGYYENGRLKDEFDFPLNDRFSRREFKVKVRSGKSGEIRVYTTDGREDVIEVDQEITKQGTVF